MMDYNLFFLLFDKDQDAANPVSNGIIGQAISDLAQSEKDKLGIEMLTGSIMMISIEDNVKLWEKYKGQMFSAYEDFENFVTRIIELQKGIVVKIIGDIIICFFSDRKRHSLWKSIKAASHLETYLKTNPIVIVNDNEQMDQNERNIHIKISLSYGRVYRRSLHIQKKRLYDYHGDLFDNMLHLHAAMKTTVEKCISVYISNEYRHLFSKKKYSPPSQFVPVNDEIHTSSI